MKEMAVVDAIDGILFKSGVYAFGSGLGLTGYMEHYICRKERLCYGVLVFYFIKFRFGKKCKEAQIQ